jgi:hypothetical protein
VHAAHHAKYIKTYDKGQDEKVAAVLISIIAERRFDVGGWLPIKKVNTPLCGASCIRSEARAITKTHAIRSTNRSAGAKTNSNNCADPQILSKILQNSLNFGWCSVFFLKISLHFKSFFLI